MLKKKLSKKLISIAFVTMVLLSSSSCASVNNPFWPRAELNVTEVTSGGGDKGVSILQSFRQAGEFVQPLYVYNEPTVTIVNDPGLPQVNISEARVVFKVGNDSLPPIKTKVNILVPSGGQFSGTINVMRQATNLLNSAFPGNSFAREATGSADVTLIGKDRNGYISIVQFSTPINFETDPTNFPIVEPEDGNNNEEQNNERNTVVTI